MVLVVVTDLLRSAVKGPHAHLFDHLLLPPLTGPVSFWLDEDHQVLDQFSLSRQLNLDAEASLFAPSAMTWSRPSSGGERA
jgi:hypothetical protein